MGDDDRERTPGDVPEVPAEVYRRAESLCEWNVRPRVLNVTIAPTWLPDGDSFWYAHQARDGATPLRVDASSGEITAYRPTPPPPNPPADANRSPDGHWDIRVDGGDLVLCRAGDAGGRRLTDDADGAVAYAAAAQSSTFWTDARRAGLPDPPVGAWSPDGRRFVTHRLDQSAVSPLPLIEHAPAGGARPLLWQYRMPLVGEQLATAALVVVDVESGSMTPVAGEPLLVEWASPLEIGWVWWSADSRTVWFLRESRGARRLSLCAADAVTGEVREVVADDADDYVEPHPLLPWANHARIVSTPEGEAVVWPAERDGWRHLYLHDARDGRLIRRLTEGEWAVREVLHADGETVVFSACGREPGRDPYYRHVYRISTAGGGVELLTPEDADHTGAVSPSGRFLLDTASTIDGDTVHRLRDTSGRLVVEVCRADLSALEAQGWRRPERFCVPGEDGTPLYGVIYLPTDFDPSLSYPVIDSIYPGPQLIRTPKSLTIDDDSGVDAWPGPWGAQALAELGFAVINVDGAGTPLRSRAMHHASYGRLQEFALDDHVAALRALAADRPWLDLSRVGIQGHSAGAAATVRALLTRPDVYSVGVAGSGVYDLRRYIAYWGEKYQGLAGSAAYDDQDSTALADRLQGRLLLLHGELDGNVHPANTLALYAAFVAADKDVDLVLLAGMGHECWKHPYYVRRSWDFFVTHLANRRPPSGYRVASAPG